MVCSWICGTLQAFERPERAGTPPFVAEMARDPFLSLEDSVVYEEKFKRMRQMRLEPRVSLAVRVPPDVSRSKTSTCSSRKGLEQLDVT